MSARPATDGAAIDIPKIIIAGSRSITNEKWIFVRIHCTLRAWEVTEGYLVLSGAYPTGPDKIAIDWATTHGVKVELFPADWDRHDRAEAATHLIAFWDGRSRGTKSMINEAFGQGLEVVVWRAWQ